MKKQLSMFFVIAIAVSLSACNYDLAGKIREYKKHSSEKKIARAQFADLLPGDLIEVESGHVLYVTENMMNENYVMAVPFVGAGKDYYAYEPLDLSKCLVRMVRKGEADYDKVLLAFAKQGIWHSLK